MSKNNGKIRVLIADDSVLIREAIKNIFSSDSDIQVVGEARDGYEAVCKARELKPDVITMDLQMPKIDGLNAIEQIMEETPIPIIVVSGMDVKLILKALCIGAMDFVAITDAINNVAEDLVEKVKIASRVKPLRRMKVEFSNKKSKVVPDRNLKFKIVAIGISTGGPMALQVVLSKLPADFNAAIVVVQHISAGFIEGLAGWLKGCSCLDVRVAKSGDIPQKGVILLAPDNYNMIIGKDGRVSLQEDFSRKMLHVPSIDEIMKSVAKYYREDSIGVLMTGMGKDGVAGMKAIKESGGVTIAQDEATSVVFGMNQVAIECGYVDMVLPLDRIAEELVRIVE